MKVINFNGGGTLLYEKIKINKAVDGFIAFAPGAQIDGNLNGLSHLYEHMIFNGTANNNNVSETIRNLHSHQNGQTRFGSVATTFYCPINKFEDVMKLNSDMILNSTFKSEKIEIEKRVISEEINRFCNSEEYDINCLFDNVLYGTPECRRSIVGNAENITKITKENLLEYQNKWINRQNFIASIAGNISLNKAKKMIENLFLSKMNAGEKINYQKADEQNLVDSSQLGILKNNSPKVHVRIGFPTYGYAEDGKPTFIEELFCTILNNRGILFEKIRNENGLAYCCSANIMRSKNNGVIYFDIITSKEKAKKTIEVCSEIVEALKKGISPSQLKFAKECILSERATATPFLQGVAYNLFVLNRYGKEDKSEYYWLKIAKKITVNDVNSYIIKTFNSNKIYVAVSGNITKEDLPNIEEIKQMYKINEKSTQAENGDKEQMKKQDEQLENTQIRQTVTKTKYSKLKNIKITLTKTKTNEMDKKVYSNKNKSQKSSSQER
ncbi:MAG: pitrilysin family protein [Clostridia bacterium]